MARKGLGLYDAAAQGDCQVAERSLSADLNCILDAGKNEMAASELEEVIQLLEQQHLEVRMKS